MIIDEWLQSYATAAVVHLPEGGAAKGLCRKVAGARALYAGVGLQFQPADELRFSVGSTLDGPAIAECHREGWVPSIWLGVLDVMLTTPVPPITRFHCILTSVETHEVDSCKDAFRLAARYATRAFLKEKRYVLM
jgi:hypothetical protein